MTPQQTRRLRQLVVLLHNNDDRIGQYDGHVIRRLDEHPAYAKVGDVRTMNEAWKRIFEEGSA